MVGLSGWVKLYRKILESPVFTTRRPSVLKVFVACLTLANHAPRLWYNGHGEVEIPRGSFVTSQHKLAELTKLTRKQVRGALEQLHRHESIRLEARAQKDAKSPPNRNATATQPQREIWAKLRAKQCTAITVMNFETYQGSNEDEGQVEGQARAKQGPSKGHNGRIKELKKKEKDIVPGSSGSRNFSADAKAVLSYLCQVTKRAYRPVETTLRPIEARLRSGVSVRDCMAVIAVKAEQWRGDPKMDGYLRPETLFGKTKFESYLAEARHAQTEDTDHP